MPTLIPAHHAQTNASKSDSPGDYPGDEGVWMFVFADLIVFSLFFLTFLFYRAQSPDAFEHGHQQLTHALGVLNTLILLSSSWCAASAVVRLRVGDSLAARLWLRAALLLGFAFVAFKSYEFVSISQAGYGLNGNDFFMFFFIFGGIHLVHVLVGLVVLLVLHQMLKRPALDARAVAGVESGAIYWHLVDVLWIILFTLFYLLS